VVISSASATLDIEKNMIKKSNFLILAALLLVSCHYHDDKLVIRNSSNKNIRYETLTKSVYDNQYYQISGGGEIDVHNTDSPPVRGSIKDDIEDEASDKNLYVVFYDPKYQEYVYKNINTIAISGEFKVIKYSKNELEKIGWIINYNGN
jgi:hypothetical protein